MSKASFAERANEIGKMIWKATRHVLFHNGWVKLIALLISLVLWAGLISQDESLTRDKTWQNVNVSVTGEESKIECKGYFAALGHVPSTGLFKGLLDMNAAGYLTLQGQSSCTSMEGVFAAGDCADPVYRQAIHAAGMGCAAAIDAERWLNR